MLERLKEAWDDVWEDASNNDEIGLEISLNFFVIFLVGGFCGYMLWAHAFLAVTIFWILTLGGFLSLILYGPVTVAYRLIKKLRHDNSNDEDNHVEGLGS